MTSLPPVPAWFGEWRELELTSNDYARLAGIAAGMAAEVDPGDDKNADFYHGRKVAYSLLCQASKALHNLAERAGAIES